LRGGEDKGGEKKRVEKGEIPFAKRQVFFALIASQYICRYLHLKSGKVGGVRSKPGGEKTLGRLKRWVWQRENGMGVGDGCGKGKTGWVWAMGVAKGKRDGCE